MAKRTLDQLYALTIPEIQDVFLQVMQDSVDRAILEEMVKAIENNDPEALFRASGFTPAVLAPIIDRIEQTYRQSAEITVEGWPKRIRTSLGIVQPIFNMRNPRVEQDLRDFSSQWITRIGEEARQNVRQVLQEGLVRGENPLTIARDIVGRVNPVTKKREGGVIGLTETQVQWVFNTGRYLRDLDKRYFDLSLRDRRFDSTVKTAIETGKPLSAETISRLTTSYKNKALKYRADMIARTETMQAINRGENAAHNQAIDDGLLQRQQIKKWWDDTGDKRVRTTHNVLGEKYTRKQPIDFDEPFVSSSGSQMMFPGDKSLGAAASEIINCRCRVQYAIDWRYGLEDD